MKSFFSVLILTSHGIQYIHLIFKLICLTHSSSPPQTLLFQSPPPRKGWALYTQLCSQNLSRHSLVSSFPSTHIQSVKPWQTYLLTISYNKPLLSSSTFTRQHSPPEPLQSICNHFPASSLSLPESILQQTGPGWQRFSSIRTLEKNFPFLLEHVKFSAKSLRLILIHPSNLPDFLLCIQKNHVAVLDAETVTINGTMGWEHVHVCRCICAYMWRSRDNLSVTLQAL